MTFTVKAPWSTSVTMTSMTLLMALICMDAAVLWSTTSAVPVFPKPLSKYAFTEVSNCKGIYDVAIYARLTNICDDCYNLFRDPDIHTLCR